jgi:hypothetical protein
LVSVCFDVALGGREGAESFAVAFETVPFGGVVGDTRGERGGVEQVAVAVPACR